jgi:phosphoglycolate phosphatase-like HAD superfamily hydrolase
MGVRAFFFDIDGTLVDSNELHVLAWHEAFVRHGMQVSSGSIRRQIGKGADMLIPALLPDSDPLLRKAIDAGHGEIFASRYLPRVKPFRRATEIIQVLHRRRIPTVLASSAKQEELEHYVRLLGIGDLLAGVVTSQDVDQSKPAGDIFAVALQKLDPIPARQTLAVGDTVYDVLSAKRNGIDTLALRTGPFTDSELQEAGALAIYDNVAAILADLDHVLDLTDERSVSPT